MDDLNVKHGDLCGESIMPRKYSERTVSSATLTAIWFGMSVQLSIFMSAGQLFPALTGWQILIALIVAHTLLAVVMWFTEDIGIKYGVPFAVAMRPSFGYRGTHIPAYLRAIPAIFWFGFQTWLAALAVTQVTDMLFGWSNLYLYIVIMGALQILMTYYGIKFVSWFNWIVSPLLLVIGFYMIKILLETYDTSFLAVMQMGGEGGVSLPLGVMALIGGWATVAVSINDITRECILDPKDGNTWWNTNKRYLYSQWVGMVPASVFFGLIGVISNALTGDWNPITVITSVVGGKSPAIAIVCLLFIVMATFSTNGAANLFSPAYALSNTWPKKVTFGRGVIIAGIIGMLMMPWRAAASLVMVLSVIASALAPVAGIMICDFMMRGRILDLDALYDSSGHYNYWHGMNPAALIAYTVGLLVSIPLWDYMYFVGAFVAGVVYYILMKTWIVKVYPQNEISKGA